MDIEIVRSIGGMESKKSEWKDLFLEAIYKSLAGEPEFCIDWIKSFGFSKLASPKELEKSEFHRSARPFVAFVRNKGRLELALPLRLVPTRAVHMRPNPYPASLHWLPAQSLQGLINAHSPFTNILVRRGGEQFLAAAMHRLLKMIRWQSIDFGAVPQQSALAELLNESLHPTSIATPAESRRNLEIAFRGTFDSFVTDRPSLKKAVERAIRRLERDFGPVSLEWWEGMDALSLGFPAFIEVDSESWKARQSDGEALYKTPAAYSFYSHLVADFAQQGRSHVCALRLGGHLAAAQLCFESDSVLYGYKTSYKEKFAPKAECRPGFVLLSLIIERAWCRFSGLNPMGGSLQGWQSSEGTFERIYRIPRDRWGRLITPLWGR